MKHHVLLLCLPWPRTGSSVVFNAQMASYAAAGFAVTCVLVPISSSHRANRTAFWRDACEAFSRAAPDAVDFLRLNDRVLRLLSKLFTAQRTPLRAYAERALQASLSPGLAERLARYPPTLVHANHAQTMLVAERLQHCLVPVGGRPPPILLDTHDVQSAGGETQFSKHRAGRQVSNVELARDELALVGKAGTLAHISEHDYAYFTRALPERRHFFVPLPPPVDGLPASDTPRNIDFLFVGNWHHGNCVSLAWLLRHIGPMLRLRRWRVVFVGMVRRALQHDEPALYLKYQDYFVGEVADVQEFYRRTRVVIVPCIEGSGASVKLAEALTMGRAVVATTLALRGLPADGTPPPPGLRPADTPEAFLARMEEALRNHVAEGRENGDYARIAFSEATYRRRHMEAVNAALGTS